MAPPEERTEAPKPEFLAACYSAWIAEQDNQHYQPEQDLLERDEQRGLQDRPVGGHVGGDGRGSGQQVPRDVRQLDDQLPQAQPG